MTDEQATNFLAKLPEPLAKAIVYRARQEKKEVYTVVTEVLRQGLLVDTCTPSDLDKFIGSWEDDPEFDAAVQAFEMIDETLWR